MGAVARPPRPAVALAVLALAQFDNALEETLIGPALPAVERHYQASPTAAVWLTTGFLVAAAVTTPVVARLGDQFGRRRLLVASLAMFAVGSLVCAVGPSIGVLIAGRVIQGLGGGLGPLSLVLAREQVPRSRVPSTVGLLIASGAIGVVVGLIVVGPIVDHVSVQSVFWLLFAVAVGLAAAVWWVVPESAERVRRRIDFVGALLLAGGVAAVMLAISRAGVWGWGATPTVALLAGAAVGIGSFVVRERTAAEPLLDRVSMGMRAVWSANVAILAVGFSLFISFTLTPMIAGYPRITGYGLGDSTTKIGLLLVPNALAAVVGAFVGARLIARTGARAQLLAGTMLGMVSYIALAVIHRHALALALVPVPLGIGVGMSLGAISDLVLLSARPAEMGSAVGVNDVIQSFASALGAQVAVAVLAGAAHGPLGLPVDSGFTGGYALGAIAAGVAMIAVVFLPSRRLDPAVAEGRSQPAIGPDVR